ncbi:MAG: nucleotidyltransferase family protein, partial [Pseudomonadota bacterium]|nr:nucleotidyltransferase family protein [Pseudomonadota bacterium]
MSVRGVILAAGKSQRMGAIKQLLPFRGKPLVQHVIDAARGSQLAHLLLVLGHAHTDILQRIDISGLQIVVNNLFDTGQATSVVSGLNNGPNTEGVMFLLGDQPLVHTAFINLLITQFLVAHPLAVMPVHQNRPGNPVILGRELTQEALTLTGDTGARQLLRQHAQHVLHVEVDDPLLFH